MQAENYRVLINPADKRLEKFGQFHSILFQTIEFYKVYKKIKNYEPLFIAVEDNKREICGVLGSVILRESSGILGYFSSRSIISGGPVILNNNLKVLSILLEEYNTRINGKVIYSQFRNLRQFSSEEVLIFKKHGFGYVPHLDIIHRLNDPVEMHWKNLHKGRRKNIRRSERIGLKFREISSEEEFEIACSLVEDTYKRVKLPVSDKSLFVESYKRLTEGKKIRVFVAIFEDEIIATRMVLCYNGLIYDWYAGTSENHPEKYPNDFLPWKIIEWGAQNGFRYFDFGGAGKPDIPYGVRDYKLKFGGKLIEYGRFEKVQNPFLYRVGKYGIGLLKRI